jgi:multiple sugar transport system substrate-binding protein
MKFYKSFPILLVVLLIALSGLPTTLAQDRPYEGITVNLITFSGPQVGYGVKKRAPEFEALTGATINVIDSTFADLYTSILTDQATGTNSYDAFVMAPLWMADFVTPGYLEDLSPYVANDPDIQWDDIAPFFRNFNSSFGGNIYMITLDGDFHMLYYRKDILEAAGVEPPKTWDDYLAIAEQFHGQDLNGDGEGDYGSCIAKTRGGQSFWWIISIAGGYLQSQGTGQGAFFNTTTFQPLVKSEGFIRALEVYQKTNSYGPPDELALDLAGARSLFLTGRCMFAFDWGDIGPLAIDPTQSQVQDKVGSLIMPGSTEVINQDTGELVPCDETTCPYAIDGVNHAPFASFGGWGGAISAAAEPEVKQAAYAFLSYMNQPAQSNIDVTDGQTGFNPYRISQFENLQPWIDAGFSEAAAADYLGAIGASLNSPNMILDLSIPQQQRYEQVVLDAVISSFLAGEYTAEEAAQTIYDQWEEITEEIGRDSQKAAYLGSLGISTTE